MKNEVSEAIGALKCARRAFLFASDSLGDAAIARDGSPAFEPLQDRMIDIEHALSILIADVTKVRDTLK